MLKRIKKRLWHRYKRSNSPKHVAGPLHRERNLYCVICKYVLFKKVVILCLLCLDVRVVIQWLAARNGTFEFPSSFVTFTFSQILLGKIHHFSPLQATCLSALVDNQCRKNATLKNMTDKENFNNFLFSFPAY